MKHCTIAFFLLVLIISCNSKQKNPQSDNCSDTLMINNKMYCFDSISESYYNSINFRFPLKSDTVPIDTSVVKVMSYGIQIKTNGKEVFLKNDTADNDSRVIYSYIKTIANIEFVHIKGVFWEWTTDYLINLKTGDNTVLWEQPILSPNKKLIISCSADLVATMMPNGIQLFKIDNGVIQKVFEKEIEKWGPSETKWESDSTILIKRLKVDDKYNEKYDYVRMKIK